MLNAQRTLSPALKITTPILDKDDTLLTQEALHFLLGLHQSFDKKRRILLQNRLTRQQRIDSGILPSFETPDHIKNGSWHVTNIPSDLQDRRVEITGPVDRKMVINALNSGANCFMADFEDATAPSWRNLLDGQYNLMDAVRRTITYTDPHHGKHYTLHDTPATLMVRPRGWHLDEKHIVIDGTPMSGSLFDMGLFLFHNHLALKTVNTGPYFYLPKIEHHDEAALWAEVFTYSEKTLGITPQTIKATVLIETLPAAFQMEDILYALKDYVVGLNCGRWDYLFSYIKTLRAHPAYILPDRANITMTAPFMAAYSHLLIDTCHKRGAFAMGGMAAFIPIKGDETANTLAMHKVRADKEREVKAGHDGTWVAHPALIPIAKGVFDTFMPTPNQLKKPISGKTYTAHDLLTPIKGEITEHGLRTNINVGLHYLNAWLQGQGCVPLNNLMEDAATAEICRTQVWQWLKHGAVLEDGPVITQNLFEDLFSQEVTNDISDKAVKLFKHLCLHDTLYDFLTLPAYQEL
jgi:malate synthase